MLQLKSDVMPRNRLTKVFYTLHNQFFEGNLRQLGSCFFFSKNVTFT